MGHGSPLNVADPAKSRPWQEWGERLGSPTAILAVSAHWQDTPVTLGRTSGHAELFYDFYGFPEWMYRLQYPAPGAPALADRVEELLSSQLEVKRSDRALDHGVWVPLTHMFPVANVPVLEVSMPIAMADDELFALGAELGALRTEGVFILGTGNVTHNLSTVSWSGDTAPADWAVAFDGWAADALEARDDRALVDWRNRAPDPMLNHPSAEHYRPLVVAAGAAAGAAARFLVTGFEMGTIARRSVQFD